MNKFWQSITKRGKGERNLALLGVGAIFIALFLTAISISIYQNDGAIQLDLSRPGYEPESNIEYGDQTWSATGNLDNGAIDEFISIWDDEISNIKNDAFRPTPLSDESLGLEK